MAGRAPQNAYLQTQIKTASKEQLLVMLFDGAIRFAFQAKAAIEARQIEQASNLCIKVQNIVNELMSSLDRELITAELYTNLMSLYSFVHKRMVQANIERNPAHVDEAVEILNRLRLVWKDAIDTVLAENNGRLPDRSEVTPPENSAAKLSIGAAGDAAISLAPRSGQLSADEARPATLGKNTAQTAYANTGRPPADSPVKSPLNVPNASPVPSASPLAPAAAAASQKFPMPTTPGAPGAPSAPSRPMPPAGPTPPGGPRPPVGGPTPPSFPAGAGAPPKPAGPPPPGGRPAFVAPTANAPTPPGPPPGPRPGGPTPPPMPPKADGNGPTPPNGAPAEATSGARPRINLTKK